jgi:hypothetical protein
MDDLTALDSTSSNDGESTVRLGADLGLLGGVAQSPDHTLWVQALADAGVGGGSAGSKVPSITVQASSTGVSSAGFDESIPQTANLVQTAPAEPSVFETAWNWTKQEASGAMHAIGDFDAAHSHVLTRVAGGVQAVAGAAEAVTGTALAGLGGGATATGVGAAPGVPAMLAGGALALNGADNFQAGLRTAITGEAHHTLLADGTGAGARALGVSNGTADNIATGVDIAQGIAAGVGSRAAGKTIAAAREAAAVEAATEGRFVLNESKFKYFFGDIEKPGSILRETDPKSYDKLLHNYSRSQQIKGNLERIGIGNDEAGRGHLMNIFKKGLDTPVLDRHEGPYGTTITREVIEKDTKLQIKYFYRDGDMGAKPEVVSLIPKIMKP